MVNPRQRHKARSLSHRPVRHSKNAKRNLNKTPPIRGPKILQDIWDKQKTVKQNYAAMGLLHTSNPCSSGGVESVLEKSTNVDSQPKESRIVPEILDTGRQVIPQAFGRIVRDEAGQVVRIEVNEDPEASAAAQETQLAMEQLAQDVSVDTLSKWSMGGAVSQECGHKGPDVAKALEELSTAQTGSRTLSFANSGIGPRHTSTGETCHLQRLVDKHGEHIDRMARDRKLNPEQRTANQLRKALLRAGFCM